MPLIKASDAPAFDGPGMTAIGLAAPSRGSKENSVWRFTLQPGRPAMAHMVTREEIFVAVAGRAIATVDGQSYDIGAGDALIIPPHTLFDLSAPGDEPFEGIAVLPVGGQAVFPGQDPIDPPWAQ